MRSAFRRGVEILSEPESESVRRQGGIAENSSKSASECTGWVPKNVTQLKPVIDELIRKVIMIAIRVVSPNRNVGSSKRS
jgi:hypothetical protein